MNTQVAVTYRTTETLQAAIAGHVSVPGEAGYDQARQAWNLAADQRPSVFVLAESPTDVEQAVRFARAHRIRIAPQGTGHGSEPLKGAMLQRTVPMHSMRIDPVIRTARAEAGYDYYNFAQTLGRRAHDAPACLLTPRAARQGQPRPRPSDHLHSSRLAGQAST